MVNSTVNDRSSSNSSIRESTRVTHLKTCLMKNETDDLIGDSRDI